MHGALNFFKVFFLLKFGFQNLALISIRVRVFNAYLRIICLFLLKKMHLSIIESKQYYIPGELD